MKLSIDLSAIERVRESIGAPPANVKLIKEALKPRTRVERELVDGGSVVITDTETSEIKGKAGLLAIGDTKSLSISTCPTSVRRVSKCHPRQIRNSISVTIARLFKNDEKRTL